MNLSEFKNRSKEEVYKILSKRDDLSREEKNRLWVRLFPDPVRHMELPSLLQDLHNSPSYSQELDNLLILRAYSHVQYHRFMRHLLHAYIKDPSQIYHVEELDSDCALCGCKLPSGYSSKDSGLDLCLDCIGRLKKLDDILRWMEGENYLVFFEDR